MRTSVATVLCIALCAAPVAASAQPADRWAASEQEAIASVPPPRDTDKIVSAALSCAAQRWTLRLDLATGIDAQDGPASLEIGANAFDLEFSPASGGLEASIPRDALEPMRAGITMKLDIDGPLELALGDPVFTLRGSRVAIDAVAGRCTLRDMGDYTPVTFTPYSSYMNLVEELRSEDVKAFAVATATQPRLDAAMAEFGGRKRVLFTRICGSSWYFGSSGCNITGYAPDEGEPGWRAVYDSENVHLYIDPRSKTDGWPDIASLPVVTDGLSRVWRWNGADYDFVGELPEQGDAVMADQQGD